MFNSYITYMYTSILNECYCKEVKAREMGKFLMSVYLKRCLQFVATIADRTEVKKRG